MNAIKKILHNKCSRVWFIVTASLLVFLLIANILIEGVFYEVFVSLLGGQRVKFSDEYSTIYESEYDSKKQTLEAANAFNEKICEEGFVLLKNNNNALPLYTPESNGTNKTQDKPKISVFGKNSVNIAYGGSGSGGGTGTGAKSLYDSLKAAGYRTNDKLESFYNSSASGKSRPASPEGSNLDDGKSITVPTYETPLASYTQNVKDSYAEYNDAAIIVITRMGGEGFDLPRTMSGVAGARKEDDHYLQLDRNEADLIKEVSENPVFQRVILILNVGTSFELGFLEEAKASVYNQLKGYEISADRIDAALWIGFPGNSGVMALGRILNGNVNPSGRTTDTYAMDFKQAPSWENFGDNNVANGDRFYDGTTAQPYYFVDYEENIYVGYRYYETRGNGNDEWYNENVVYPMGHGLSYSEFEWEIIEDSSIRDIHINKNGKYTVKVKVTNNGSVAGRDVVQLYGHAPYAEGAFGLQKPYEVLLDFAKTEIIPAGESREVTLNFDPYYLASYDYKDSNYNGITGYELEPGAYELYVSKNAHDKKFTIPFTVDGITVGESEIGITYSADPVTGNTIENRYTDWEDSFYNSDFHLTDTLNRDDWNGTWPTTPVAEGRDERQLGANAPLTGYFANTDVSVFPWTPDYSGEIVLPNNKEVTVKLRDLVTDADGVYAFGKGENIDYSKPFVDYNDIRWETLLEQTSFSDLNNMRDYGAFKSGDILDIGKPLTNDTDGPSGFVNFMLNDGTYHDTCYYACQMVVASTWSKEVAEDFGEMVGEEGIWGADGKGNGMPYSGWYAPGVNIHRSPFGGRNFEYMSEDGVLTGKMAASQIKGCLSKGVYCFMKHFAINDQETHRSINGISVWVTEQAMREIYLKPFEIAVKEGGARGVMSSFNRIGSVWAGGDYRLLTQILRGEWGFKGMVISDFTSGNYMNSKQMAYAGGDLNLNNQGQYAWSGFDASDAADVSVLRQCAKNIMYTVVNSNAMNREVVGYKLPLWQALLISFDCILVVGLSVWGFFAVRSALKKNEVAEAPE